VAVEEGDEEEEEEEEDNELDCNALQMSSDGRIHDVTAGGS
jgi:hypothetical protein